MEKPIMDLNQVDLQAEVTSYKVGLNMVWPTFFPLRYTPKMDFKSLSGNEGLPISADRIAFNVKAPVKTRKKIGQWGGTLAKIAISRSKDENDINDYNDLRTLAAKSDTDVDMKNKLIDIVYDDVTFVHDGMDAKVEVDACDIASHGIQSYKEIVDGDNATSDVINFNVPAENFMGASKAWDNAEGADGIGDIIKAKAVIKKAHKPTPRFAIMEQAAFDLLIAQKKTLTRLSAASALATGTVMVTPDSVDLDRINRYMTSKGFPTIVVIDTEVSIEGKDGVETPLKPWAENVVTLAPSLTLGHTYYKTVPIVENSPALQAYAKFYKVTRYSELNPMQEVTLAEAYMQVVLENRASTAFINTAKTSWSNGAA